MPFASLHSLRFSIQRIRSGMLQFIKNTYLILGFLYIPSIVFISGCLPIPNLEPLSPEIVGNVTKAGAPVKNAAIRLAPSSHSSAPCEDPRLVVTTDRNGNFRFEPQRRFRLFIQMENYADWEICIESRSKNLLAWQSAPFVSYTSGLKLQCELDRPPAVQSNGRGICQQIP